MKVGFIIIIVLEKKGQIFFGYFSDTYHVSIPWLSRYHFVTSISGMIDGKQCRKLWSLPSNLREKTYPLVI